MVRVARCSAPLIALALVIQFSFCGCINQRAREALTIQPEALSLRNLQTRRFETKDEALILSAAVDVLQDLGFEIDETESGLGVIVASKNRDATSTPQIVGSIIIGGLSDSPPIYEVEQRIRASLVTRPVEHSSIAVRITFQRTVWNNRGEISTNESLEDPELYRDFFAKLSESIFLAPLQL